MSIYYRVRTCLILILYRGPFSSGSPFNCQGPTVSNQHWDHGRRPRPYALAGICIKPTIILFVYCILCYHLDPILLSPRPSIPNSFLRLQYLTLKPSRIRNNKQPSAFRSLLLRDLFWLLLVPSPNFASLTYLLVSRVTYRTGYLSTLASLPCERRMGNPSPGSSSSTSATVPLILHRQNGYQATSSIPLPPSLSPSASPMAISRRTIVLLNHCDVEKNFLDESDAQENAGPTMSSVPLASPPNAATTLSLAPSLERQGGQRKRRRSGSDSDYSPPYSLRGGGRPQKSKARRNANNGPHSGQSQSDRSSRRTTRSKARRANSPSSLIITSLEDIKSEDAAVKSEISRLGLTLRDVQGDGNCLFRCLSDQLYGTEVSFDWSVWSIAHNNKKRHAEIRKVVCDYLDSHKETMEGFVVPFMKEGERYEGYVQRMRQSSGFKSQDTFLFADTIKILKQNNLAVT